MRKKMSPLEEHQFNYACNHYKIRTIDQSCQTYYIDSAIESSNFLLPVAEPEIFSWVGR
jgi:hypothetical protein